MTDALPLPPDEEAVHVTTLRSLDLFATNEFFTLYAPSPEKRTRIPWGDEQQYAAGIRAMAELYRGQWDIDDAYALFESVWMTGTVWVDANTTKRQIGDNEAVISQTEYSSYEDFIFRRRAKSIAEEDATTHDIDTILMTMEDVYEFIDNHEPVQNILIETTSEQIGREIERID